MLYTAISINVVRLKLQTFESRPNGGMGIYWNLQISVEEIRETFLVSFLSLLRGLEYSFKSKCGEKESFLHMSEEKGIAKSLFCCIAISH